MEEFRKNGGYGSNYFWGMLKNNRVKGIKSLRDLREKISQRMKRLLRWQGTILKRMASRQ